MAPKRTRLKAEERRQLILEAARRVFLENGFAGARTRRIAEEADITEALLYRFFPSKLAIYEAAVLQPLEEFVARMLAATGEIEASSDDREDGLRRINEMLFHFMRESAPFLAVVLLSELNEGRRFYQNDFHPVLSKPINDVVSRITGWRSPKGDSSLIFAAMLGVHMGLAIDGLLRDAPPDEAGLAGQLTALFSDGMPDEAQQTPVSFPARPGGSGVSPERRAAAVRAVKKPTRAVAAGQVAPRGTATVDDGGGWTVEGHWMDVP